jgi:hypothetical protein
MFHVQVQLGILEKMICFKGMRQNKSFNQFFFLGRRVGIFVKIEGGILSQNRLEPFTTERETVFFYTRNDDFL